MKLAVFSRSQSAHSGMELVVVSSSILELVVVSSSRVVGEDPKEKNSV